jgi:integrase/recombinase XerD
MTLPGQLFRVQRLVMPGSGAESWTLPGDEGRPVEPVERFLACPGSIERSPNTVKAYAHDLKDSFGAWTGRRSRWRTSPRSPGGCGWP